MSLQSIEHNLPPRRVRAAWGTLTEAERKERKLTVDKVSGAKYRAGHPDKEKVRTAKYRAKNREKIRARAVDQRSKYPAKEKTRTAKYRTSPKGRETKRKRIATDLNYFLACTLRGRLSIAIRGNAKSGSAVEDLGCSIQDFKLHIAAQFTDGMSWENFGRKTWHLDHVLPLAAFNLEDRAQFLVACHYSNYQPLWAINNHRKNSKIDRRLLAAGIKNPDGSPANWQTDFALTMHYCKHPLELCYE